MRSAEKKPLSERDVVPLTVRIPRELKKKLALKSVNDERDMADILIEALEIHLKKSL